MAYLKHKDGERPKKSKTTKKQETPPPPPVVTVDVDMSGVEAALMRLAGIASTYTSNEVNGDNGSGLYSSPDSHPVKVALHEDSEPLYVCLEVDDGGALTRIATAFERIADALTGKQAQQN
jgi:hypothetical protein